MWDRHPIRFSLVHMLPQVADRHGLALAPLLGRAGIDGGLGDDAVVARAQISTLLQETARRSGEPTIGLDLAARAEPVRLGLSGRALFSGRTLRECLTAQSRHMPTLQGGVHLELGESDGRAFWRHTLEDSEASHAGVLNEGVAGFMARALRAIASEEAGALRVSLPHQARAPLRVYEDKLAADVTFGNGRSIVIGFDARWLDRPSPLFGAEWASADGAPKPVMRWDAGDDAALVAMLERLIGTAALAGTLSLTDAARSLGLAPRTLQRRLAVLGLSFEVLVEQWRHRQARQDLAETAFPVTTIARRLGYSDPAHFIRAFRRWEGHPPLAWRRAAWREMAIEPRGGALLV